MSWQVLLVAPTLASDLFAWLSGAGYDVTLVDSFEDAKAQLRSLPDLVISEIRLGDYNGLHLASRARGDGIPAIVIGDADVVLERDAEQMDITYIHSDTPRESLLSLAERLAREGGRERVLALRRANGSSANLAFLSSRELRGRVASQRSARRSH